MDNNEYRTQAENIQCMMLDGELKPFTRSFPPSAARPGTAPVGGSGSRPQACAPDSLSTTSNGNWGGCTPCYHGVYWPHVEKIDEYGHFNV